MAKIITTHELTEAGQDGWWAAYTVVREDGREIEVDARCTGTGDVVARDHGDPETLAFIEDKGRAAAVKFAEHAQPPKRRGRVTLVLSVDELSGLLLHDFRY